VLRWNDSWHYLRKLFWQPGREFDLTRRWMLTDTDHVAKIFSATAKAQCSNPLELTMTGRTRATFQVDLVLADPFFYGAETNTQLDYQTPVVIHNPGDYTAAHQNFTIQLVGPLDRPEIYNSSSSPATRVKLDTTIAAGETVTLDVERFTAVSNQQQFNIDGTGNYSRLTSVIHSGARHWMGLAPGDNTLTLYAVSGTGHAVVRFRPPYV
jgi:hypothetical protein